MKGKNERPSWGYLGLLTSVGGGMVANLLVGLLIGRFLDNWLDTHPWLTFLFLLLGAGAGFRAIYKLVSK